MIITKNSWRTAVAAASFAFAAAPAVAGGFVTLPSTGADIRVIGSNDSSRDQLDLGSGWTPGANGYTFVSGKSIGFIVEDDGATLTVGTFYDAVYRRNSDNTLLFASRVVLNSGAPGDDDDPLNETEINLIWRSGFAGFTTQAAWYKETSEDFRLQAAAATGNVFSANATNPANRLPASGNYGSNYVGFRTDISVDEGAPTGGWYLVQTDALNFIDLANGVHIRENASVSEGREQIDWLLAGYAPTAVPEPSEYALMAVGLFALGAVVRRRSSA